MEIPEILEQVPGARVIVYIHPVPGVDNSERAVVAKLKKIVPQALYTDGPERGTDGKGLHWVNFVGNDGRLEFTGFYELEQN